MSQLIIKRTEDVSSDWAKNQCWVLTDKASGWKRVRRVYTLDQLLKIIGSWQGVIRIH